MKMKMGLILVLLVSIGVEAQDAGYRLNNYANNDRPDHFKKFKISSGPSLATNVENSDSNKTLEKSKFGISGSADTECVLIVDAYQAAKMSNPNTQVTKGYSQCLQLKAMSNLNNHNTIALISMKDSFKKSTNGKIVCERSASYTMDFKACETALVYYEGVIIAEQALELQQKIRTDLKNSALQKQAAIKTAEGDAQTGVFDAGIELNKQQKEMQIEKAGSYSLAVGALMKAYAMIPGEKAIIKKCKEGMGQIKPEEYQPDLCEETVKTYKPSILSNQNAKVGLVAAAAEFVAKGVAAGIAMGQYKTKADAIVAAKKSYEDPSEDLMMEQCAFNPTDPACARSRDRVSGQSTFQGADFGVGDGTNNAFNMNPNKDEIADIGAETNLDDLKNPIAGINSPFVDAAKEAKGIMNPAAAASFQATGGAAGGGGAGGGGVGGGGGGASLGSDLQGLDKDANSEAQIKTGKVSGAYAQASGGGYKGVGKGKEEAANPFASLFDAKSEGGGVEEDRSIASGDVDGAASGLFQKISKRYGQIQADKRIEANNLE